VQINEVLFAEKVAAVRLVLHPSVSTSVDAAAAVSYAAVNRCRAAL
jgi:hypothetical protein